jgi:hypothetical protein
MPENEPLPLSASTAVQFHLRTIAQVLHQGQHLGPEVQELLAKFVEELGNILDSALVPSSEVAHLSECAAQLIQAAHGRQEKPKITAAKDRLERAIVAVEAKFPALADVGSRIVDTLSGLGI